MLVSINQPAYLPWLGYYQRIARADLHIVLDHVQFEKNSFVNRNKVRTTQGWCWLTVPVRTTGQFGNLPITGLEIADARWASKHWATLQQNYRKAPHFAALATELEALYAAPWTHLAPLMARMSELFLRALQITTPLRTSTELAVSGTKADLVLNLCKAVGATAYLSGPLGRDYLQPEPFAEAGIELLFDEFHHPTYRQCHPGFEPGMGVVDLLANEGPNARTVLESARTVR